MPPRSCAHLLLLTIQLCLFLPFLFSCHKEGVQQDIETTHTLQKYQKAPASVPHRVTFESMNPDQLTGTPEVIHGLLFMPAEAASRRLPAIIALHGCGGMYSSAKSKRDELSVRHQAMADLLVAEGYAVLFPDSFRSRGFEELCTVENRKRTVTQQHRRLDAQGALAWLQQRSDIQPDRIAILGWSHGGSAVLATLNAKQPVVTDWKGREPATPYFRAGVAFYPGCSESLKVTGGYSLSAPLTFFIGGSDDWTAPGPCIELAAQLAAAGEDATVTVYPDTYHGFDGPSTQPRLRLEVPNGVKRGKGVTVAANPEARDDAYAKLRTYLRRHLAP